MKKELKERKGPEIIYISNLLKERKGPEIIYISNLLKEPGGPEIIYISNLLKEPGTNVFHMTEPSCIIVAYTAVGRNQE